MARLELNLPEHAFCFSTQIEVRVTDVNAADHLGNEALVALLSEARARFLQHLGIDETGRDGPGILVADLAVKYRAEAHRHDALLFETGFCDFNKYGADIIYRVSRPADQTLIAIAKTGFVFFDYQAGKMLTVPDYVRQQFAAG